MTVSPQAVETALRHAWSYWSEPIHVREVEAHDQSMVVEMPLPTAHNMRLIRALVPYGTRPWLRLLLFFDLL